MNVFRMLVVDIREGLLALRWWYAAVPALFVVGAVSLHLQASLFGCGETHFSAGDYLISFFAGMKEFSLYWGEPFNFSSAWAATFLLAAYLVLWYPYRDLMGMGKQMIVAGGSRWSWWLSKCLWVAFNVLLFFSFAVVVACVAAVLDGGAISFTVSESLPELLGFREERLPEPPYDAAGYLVGVPLATLALCLFQLTSSLLIRPLLGFVVTLATLFLSAFYTSPYLVGNYLMAARNAAFMTFGLELNVGVSICVSISLASVLLGGLAFSRMDIVDKEGLS